MKDNPASDGTSLNAHYALLLGLGDAWRVAEVDLDLKEQRVVILIETAAEATMCCAECGEARPLKDHAKQRQWRHLDTMQFETVILASIPRTNCPTCGVKNVSVPWAEPHGRFTMMFEAFAIRVLQAAANIEKGRQLLGLSWSSAQAIMTSAVERGVERRSVDEVQHVGIDEKNFKRGQSYISLLTDIDGSRILEVVPDRTKQAADLLWKTLSKQQRDQVQAVALDMWSAFMTSSREHAPQAALVHDRFHISKALGDAVDKVRRSEQKVLKKEGDDRLTGTRFLWLRNSVNLNEEQSETFASLKKAKLKTARAWAMKEMFGGFWSLPDKQTGAGYFESWYSWAVRGRLEPMKRVAKTLQRHKAGLLAYFDHGVTNAAAEGFNSVVQGLKSAARGFRNFANYRTRILFFCGKLQMHPDST